MVISRPWLHGFLDLCLLAMLGARSDYGYGLSQRLAASGVADVPGGTLYPALLRLEQQGLVEPSWAPSESGPRRKYYALTDAGRGELAAQGADWRRFRAGLDSLVGATADAVGATADAVGATADAADVAR